MMDLIAGLQSPTSGTIDINGSGGVGICPQKNVLWDKLTCEEHVYYFNQLKAEGQKGKSSDHQDLLSRCDLAHKISARSETLSGGQKRKLQVFIVFDSYYETIFIPRISTCQDPCSRRASQEARSCHEGEKNEFELA